MCWNLEEGKHILSSASGVVAPTWKGLLQCLGCLTHVSASPWYYEKLISGDTGKHWGLSSEGRSQDSLECGREFSHCKGRSETFPCLLHLHLGICRTFEARLNFIIFSMPSILFFFLMFKPDFFLQEWFWDSLHSSDSILHWYLAIIPYQLLGASRRGQHSHRVHFSCESAKGFVVDWRWKKRLTCRKDMLLCWVVR